MMAMRESKKREERERDDAERGFEQGREKR